MEEEVEKRTPIAENSTNSRGTGRDRARMVSGGKKDQEANECVDGGTMTWGEGSPRSSEPTQNANAPQA